MLVGDTVALDERAARLLQDMIDCYDPLYGLGYMSCAVYDTAWLAMITKNVEGEIRWLFPLCFRYILDSQLPSGGWESYASDIDGILNTMAALLALTKHIKTTYQLQTMTPGDMESRIQRATVFLQDALEKWDVSTTLHVGYEILVPALLDFLKDEGIAFDFPGRRLLTKKRDTKMAKLHPSLLYETSQTTLVHSLEAFIGTIDFDRVSHHKILGSMMASPSSTAAYLMHSTTWDDESEYYLRHVISRGEGKSNGGVPSAFPSTHFEFTWVLSTLLKGGYTQEDLGSHNVGVVIGILENGLEKGDGLIGFAPLVNPDADDTAKAIEVLNLLGRSASPVRMIEIYEVEDHFKTYLTETNASFSANCNVLGALLSVEAGMDKYAPQIEKAVRFLCESWWHANGKIEDKWNLSPHYPMMLLSQVMMQVVVLWDRGRLPFMKEQVLSDRVSILLFQILSRALLTQNPDGSWGDPPSHETTCYAILTLINLASLPIGNSLQQTLQLKVEEGRRFLNIMDRKAVESDYLWIEKVTYRSNALLQSYQLAALKASSAVHEFGDKIKATFSGSLPARVKFTRFYSQLPLFADTPEWAIESALLESYLYLPQLKLVRLDIFPRKNMPEDKYFEYIPFTWAASNNLKRAFLKPAFLFDMMVISFLNYQADEYMEKVVGESFAHRLGDIRKVIGRVFETIIGECSTDTVRLKRKHSDGSVPGSSANENDIRSFRPAEHVEDNVHAVLEYSHGLLLAGSDMRKKNYTAQTANDQTGADFSTSSDDRNGAGGVTRPDMPHMTNGASIDGLDEVYAILKRFVGHVLKHRHVQTASAYDQVRLHRELKTFLLAHIDQIEDNSRLAMQRTNVNTPTIFQNPRTTFFDWVRTTSANHTSCPYSFALVTCFFGQHKDFFPTSTEKYLAQAVCRHLATLCRLYNDYGSLARDRVEKNLNSVNFPEFHAPKSPEGDDQLQKQLFSIAAFERKCLELTLAELSQVTSDLDKQVIEVFCNVTDMFGQIYVKKDIASRMKG